MDTPSGAQSRARAFVAGTIVSVLSMLALMQVASALAFPLFEIGWLGCVLAGFATMRALSGRLPLLYGLGFVTVALLVTGLVSRWVSVYVFRDTL
jgi:hypothetical protein